MKKNQRRWLEMSWGAKEKWENIKRPLSWNVDVYWIDRWWRKMSSIMTNIIMMIFYVHSNLFEIE